MVSSSDGNWLGDVAGSRNALPPGIPDAAAELGAPIDLRYPAVYVTRRGHEDIDEVVDPEFL